MVKNKTLTILDYGNEDFSKKNDYEIELEEREKPSSEKLPKREKITVSKKSKDDKVFNGQFITAVICYYIEFKCPNCGKFNLHRHKNIFDCVGPDWASKPVTCKGCNMDFYVKEDYGKLYKDI